MNQRVLSIINNKFYYLTIYHSFVMSNVQKIKNNVIHVMNILSQLVDGHKYSPGDAEQGKYYPVNLKDLINIYFRLTIG